MASEDGYLLDNADPDAAARIGALSAVFDDSTFRHLDATGVGPGWHCWEVGAGGAGVPRRLAARVGRSGRVLATDVDVSLLQQDGGDAFEVRRHDVGLDPAPVGPFDLVHARLVLVHVPRRDEALRAMAAALRPGGWLVVEDADPALQPLACPDEWGPEQARANRLRTGLRSLLAERGADLAYGRHLPRLLREVGLVDVAAEAFFPLASAAGAVLEVATMKQIRERLVTGGLAGHREIDEHVDAVAAGRVDVATAPMVSAWGRRPPAGDL